MTSEGKIEGVKWASRGSPGGYRWVLLAVRRPVCLLASNASLKVQGGRVQVPAS